MTDQPVELETRDRVIYATLQNPQELNGITEESFEGLEAACDRVEKSTSVSALVVTGVEDIFCVGLHLRLLDRGFKDHRYFRSILERFNELLFRLGSLPVPVVAAVNGTCRAGGFELMLASDLVLVANEAVVGDVHTPFGVMPGGGSTQRLPRLVGMPRAREIILTGRWLNGEEVARLGLALRSVPRLELGAAVEELVDQFRGKSRACLAAVKAVMHDGIELDIRSGVRLETQRFMEFLERSRDSNEGFTAYRESREPHWEN